MQSVKKQNTVDIRSHRVSQVEHTTNARSTRGLTKQPPASCSIYAFLAALGLDAAGFLAALGLEAGFLAGAFFTTRLGAPGAPAPPRFLAAPAAFFSLPAAAAFSAFGLAAAGFLAAFTPFFSAFGLAAEGFLALVAFSLGIVTVTFAAGAGVSCFGAAGFCKWQTSFCVVGRRVSYADNYDTHLGGLLHGLRGICLLLSLWLWGVGLLFSRGFRCTTVLE
jgi:hypothetical protein